MFKILSGEPGIGVVLQSRGHIFQGLGPDRLGRRLLTTVSVPDWHLGTLSSFLLRFKAFVLNRACKAETAIASLMTDKMVYSAPRSLGHAKPADDTKVATLIGATAFFVTQGELASDVNHLIGEFAFLIRS
jgi:hypothetical protein